MDRILFMNYYYGSDYGSYTVYELFVIGNSKNKRGLVV